VWRSAPEVLTRSFSFIALHLLGYAVNGRFRRRAANIRNRSGRAACRDRRTEIHVGIAIALVSRPRSGGCSIERRRPVRATDQSIRCRWAGVHVNAQIARAMAISGGVAGWLVESSFSA